MPDTPETTYAWAAAIASLGDEPSIERGTVLHGTTDRYSWRIANRDGMAFDLWGTPAQLHALAESMHAAAAAAERSHLNGAA